MARLLLCCLLAVFWMPPLFAQDAPPPLMDGYVSQLTSQTSFAVDGRVVEVEQKPGRECYNLAKYRPPKGPQTLALGDHLLIFGDYDGPNNRVSAHTVCKVEWDDEKVSGEGVVEAIDGQRLLVDGRLLELAPASVVKPIAPRTSLADAQINDWVHYSATLQPATGRYLVHSLTLEPNTVTPHEDKLHAAKFVEFEPPDVAAKRDGSIKFAHVGHRFRLPANDQIDRLTRLGGSLIPAYQKSLAPADPVRIAFHFYPIDGHKLSGCVSTPQGDVFVSMQAIERLPQDSDLAPILATCVAELIERQGVRMARVSELKWGMVAGGVTAGLFVPGLEAVSSTGSYYAQHLQWELQQQSARVSLDLLAAAGYAPGSAPHAWESAEAKDWPPKLEAQPNPRVSYLYRALAERERREQ